LIDSSFKPASLTSLYQHPLTLLTDLYQLSMAYGYWASGSAHKEAVFQLYFRHNPFHSGYTVAAGMHAAVEYIREFRFSRDDLDYVRTLTGVDGQRLFAAEFLDYLRDTPLSISVDGVEEGRVVFANQPLIRVQGPIIQCQLLETALLNLINFPTLIATKAARICAAAGGDPVLEFGLRRAQGIDGGLTASRAAYIGGCDGTSNVLAGKLYGIPVKGTHAHSWVMSFDDEKTSFMEFAKAMPGNCIFLVDTYNTRQGVAHAIEAGQYLKAVGRRLYGIRLDSGDLAWLSREARKDLDAAGFEDAFIVASNDLDEHLITSLKTQGAPIGVWGVGTKLVTGFDEPALGGVYKMVALRDSNTSQWQYKMKLSEQLAKITTPGIQQIRRFSVGHEFVADMIYDSLQPPQPGKSTVMVDPSDMTRRKQIPVDASSEDLLIPLVREGKCVYDRGSDLNAARARLKHDLSQFHEGIRRLANPHSYPVGLERGLYDRKAKMILDLRGFKEEP
jgi:nicotinate phosphoribosyltransferase